MAQFQPATSHLALGPDFFDPVEPAHFPKHILRYRNARWADRVGLGELAQDQWVDHFGKFVPLPGSFEKPLALRYHGHQFGTYNPDLGDGRGFLFAQFHEPGTGRLLDLATKGSGRTPWSRGADGRLTLKGGVREVLATAMLEALGVNTSKTFSLIETGEELERGDEPSPTRSSVLVRLSHSHIRIGSFQRLAFLKDETGLKTLLDYAIKTYRPDCWREDLDDRASAFLTRVAEDVAETGARWIAAGFVHGVLNTDNINITGESFDYGPWRFLPTYDPAFTAAYFDHNGLYAFGRQPDTLAWNLTRLAECLVPLASPERLEPALNAFWPAFQREMSTAILARLGLAPIDPETDSELVAALFTFLGASQMPFEQAFFDLRGGLGVFPGEVDTGSPVRKRDKLKTSKPSRIEKSPGAPHYRTSEFAPLKTLLERYAPSPNANLGHPYFARTAPRTMLIEDVETIWAPIATDDDWSALEKVLTEIELMRKAYTN